MKSKNTFRFIVLIVSISLSISGYSGNKSVKATERDRLLNTGWKFIRDSIADAEQPGYDDSDWMVVDRNKLKADRNDLAFVKIEVIDANGQLVPRDSITVKLILSGNGELVASGNANPKDMASVNRPQINTYRGKSLAIVRPSVSGNVKLMAESRGLKTGELTIQVTE